MCAVRIYRRIGFQMLWLAAFASFQVSDPQQTNADAAERPHIVLILADDLGYGDVQPLNLDSQIPTPSFQRLARQAITFTDAHTPSAVCTPTRYGLLTGQYCWRTRLKSGVLDGYGKPLIDTNRATLASMLKDVGYETTVIGKWHLGLGLVGGRDDLDLSQPLTHHPGSVGFDHSLIIPASLDFPPYVYFRDGQATTDETTAQESIKFPGFLRAGPRANDFDMRACLDHLTDAAERSIASMADASQPQFLYFPLTAPHKPVLPAERFIGKSGRGLYGDFVQQVDDTLGRVLDAIDAASIGDRTLLIVTSDNGSYMYRIAADKDDHLQNETIQGYHVSEHQANGPWRGTKADIWEAGHRVPFFVRLPGAQHGGASCGRLVGLIDVFATLADWLGQQRDFDEGPDSVSFKDLLENPLAEFQRPPLICHSAAGMFAVRDANWKLVAGNGSGGREKPRGEPFGKPYQLFDLSVDPGETENLYTSNPAVAARLVAELTKLRGE